MKFMKDDRQVNFLQYMKVKILFWLRLYMDPTTCPYRKQCKGINCKNLNLSYTCCRGERSYRLFSQINAEERIQKIQKAVTQEDKGHELFVSDNRPTNSSLARFAGISDVKTELWKFLQSARVANQPPLWKQGE